MKKMMIIAIIAVIVIAMMIPVKVKASKKCSYSGCDRSVDSGSYCRIHKCGKDGCSSAIGGNGTIYCNTHAAEYVKKQGYTACADAGCYRKPSKGHTYCSTHECKNSDCTKKKVSGSDYCTNHQPKTTTTKTTVTKKTTTAKSNNKYTTGKSSCSTGKTKKYDTYDVHSYKSSQDFADDKYEEFFDYEDDFEDEDEAYDAAEDYWNDNYEDWD